MKKLSIIIPAYNEGETLFRNLAAVVTTMEAEHLDFEIILVDDGSTDTTQAEANRAAMGSSKIKVLRLEHNAGKGAAFIAGVSRSSGKYIALLDADLDLPPAQLPCMLSRLQQARADMIIGSKYHPESKISYPFPRRAMSKCYALLIKLLFNMPFTDTQSGIKIFKRGILKSVLPFLETKRFAFDVELIFNAYTRGAFIIEYPILLDYKGSRHALPLKMALTLFTETFKIWLALPQHNLAVTGLTKRHSGNRG